MKKKIAKEDHKKFELFPEDRKILDDLMDRYGTGPVLREAVRMTFKTTTRDYTNRCVENLVSYWAEPHNKEP